MAKRPAPNKDLGQHFLIDKKVIKNICRDHHGKYDAIIEIGPGPGVLTEQLCEQGLPLFIIEKDIRFQEQLLKFVQEERAIFTDALKFQWDQFLEENKLQDKKLWLVSNLPYNISAPLLVSFLPLPPIKFMTLMFQKEVGLKSLMPEYQHNNCNSLGVLSNIFFETTKLCHVPGGCFYPPPKVDSIVVSYQRKSEPELPLTSFYQFEAFLRTLFSQRRKQLGSVLRPLASSQQRNQIFTKTQINPSRRSETLKISEVIALFQGLQKLS